MIKRVFAAVATAGLTLLAGAGSADAATNPYTAQQACGSSYYLQHSMPVTTASGATYGRVYLMYSNTTKKNCAVTLKSAYVGASTLTEVYIESKNGAVDGEFDHTHLYYANAYVYSPNDCVRYQGFIWSGATTSSTLAASALSGWHGCG